MRVPPCVFYALDEGFSTGGRLGHLFPIFSVFFVPQVKEEGLWSVIAMAQSPHNMVQRHAARAFWHLAMHCENKQQIMEMGGLQTLVRLSMLCDDNPQVGPQELLSDPHRGVRIGGARLLIF